MVRAGAGVHGGVEGGQWERGSKVVPTHRTLWIGVCWQQKALGVLAVVGVHWGRAIPLCSQLGLQPDYSRSPVLVVLGLPGSWQDFRPPRKEDTIPLATT